ncbi:phosphate propanoyltransferase [Rhodopseudomonas palustris]
MQQETIERIIRQVLGQVGPAGGSIATLSGDAGVDPFQVAVGVSNRHIHLSRTDMDTLFGPGAELQRKKAMKQPGQFAAEETVTLKGPKGSLSKVRVLGPLRRETQVEVSVADGFALGITPPLRQSGQLDDTPGLTIIGPQGSVTKDHGVIVAQRHIHMHPSTAAKLGLRNGDEVDVEAGGERGGVMHRVLIRVAEASADEMHIDVEEANALCLKNDDVVRICKK